MWSNLIENLAKASNNIALEFSGWSHRIFSALQLQNKFLIVLDILIVAFLIYWFLSKLLETKAIRILYGLIILVALMLVGHFLNLQTLNWLIKYLTIAFLVALPIIFQPELRLALERLGRAGFVGYSLIPTKNKKDIIEIIVDVMKNLAERKIGALILIERKTPLREYIRSGVYLGAQLSKETLYSIFLPASPLHDGAAIISQDKIVAAGCLLPLTSEQFDARLGARHRAAISITKETDTIGIVVSQERGIISFAHNGNIEPRISPHQLAQHLSRILKIKIAE